MPVVRISDATFMDLKSISKWLETGTPGETIDRIVQREMEQLGMERDGDASLAETGVEQDVMEFAEAPGLSFTKPLLATIGGKVLPSPRWASILLAMIGQVKSKGVGGERLVRELNVPAKVERYEEEGFKYHPELGISVQGQSASDVWREVDRLAKKWGVPVVIEFWWRQNPKAQHPGRTGRLRSAY